MTHQAIAEDCHPCTRGRTLLPSMRRLLLDGLSEVCPSSRRVDGPWHSWRFDGDDPWILCAYCPARRRA